LFGGFVEDDFAVELCEGGDELFDLLLFHLADFLVQLLDCLDLGDFCFFPQEGDEAVDVMIVILDDVGTFEELLLFFGVGGPILEEGG
jgi:hypothetical protein